VSLIPESIELCHVSVSEIHELLELISISHGLEVTFTIGLVLGSAIIMGTYEGDRGKEGQQGEALVEVPFGLGLGFELSIAHV
jgi:hypothetical protein